MDCQKPMAPPAMHGIPASSTSSLALNRTADLDVELQSGQKHFVRQLYETAIFSQIEMDEALSEVVKFIEGSDPEGYQLLMTLARRNFALKSILRTSMVDVMIAMEFARHVEDDEFFFATLPCLMSMRSGDKSGALSVQCVVKALIAMFGEGVTEDRLAAITAAARCST